MRDASWHIDGADGECDELGRFTIHVPAGEPGGWTLELSARGLSARRIELEPLSRDLELGDVELSERRLVSFLVRDEAGAPIAGALAGACVERPRAAPRHPGFMSWREATSSQPTDAQGHGELHLSSDARAVVVRARGYAPREVDLPAAGSTPLEITLVRAAGVEVLLRDARGRVPRGLAVRFTAQGGSLPWERGSRKAELAMWDEFALMVRDGGWSTEVDGRADFGPDARGRIWIEPLRAGEPFDLALVDTYGTRLDARLAQVLEPGEWRRLELRVDAVPRTLIVVVSDTLGSALSRADIELSAAGEPPSPSRLFTDRAGMARSEPLYAGEVRLSVARRGFEARTLERVVVPPEGATVEVRLAHDWRAW